MAVQKKTDYSATPLPRKLGIKEGYSVLAVSAPAGFERTLEPLPAGVEVVTRAERPVDVVLWFVTGQGELSERLGELARLIHPAGGLWAVWPKKSSQIPNDLSFETVQQAGLDAGLVDNKSCSVDTEWQGLRFVYRTKDR